VREREGSVPVPEIQKMQSSQQKEIFAINDALTTVVLIGDRARYRHLTKANSRLSAKSDVFD
jgi:hypothetical protein